MATSFLYSRSGDVETWNYFISRQVEKKGTKTALFSCPKCLWTVILWPVKYQIDNDGLVDKIVTCDHCDWTEFVHLEGWNPHADLT